MVEEFEHAFAFLSLHLPLVHHIPHLHLHCVIGDWGREREGGRKEGGEREGGDGGGREGGKGREEGGRKGEKWRRRERGHAYSMY